MPRADLGRSNAPKRAVLCVALSTLSFVGIERAGLPLAMAQEARRATPRQGRCERRREVGVLRAIASPARPPRDSRRPPSALIHDVDVGLHAPQVAVPEALLHEDDVAGLRAEVDAARVPHGVRRAPWVQAGDPRVPLEDAGRLVLSELSTEERDYALGAALKRLKPGGALVLADEVRPRGAARRSGAGFSACRSPRSP